MRLRLASLLGLALLGVALPATAQLELGSAVRSLRASGSRLPASLSRGARARVAVVAEYPADSGIAELLIGERYRPMWLLPSELEPFIAEHPELKLHWAPPRHVLMDQAQRWVGGKEFRDRTGFTGQGVVVGIIDTGLDVTHPDLQNADGTSRVRFMLDCSRPPGDRQPDLEDEYGCTGDAECAIYDNADLDALMSNGITGDEPRDSFGHGTHVASLAAGNGLSNATPRYIGIAPEALIFGARVSRAGDGAIQDPDILLATRFIFEQAERLGLPAVVNLSLGSDFGAHDGSSALEQGLASFVGPAHPGRALVISAGNSGTLFAGIGTGEPEPYGIHTEVHVPRESPVEVPIMTPTAALGATRGATIYAWLGFRDGDDVTIALDKDGQSFVPDVRPGQSTTFDKDDYSATVFNGPSTDQSSIRVGRHDAVVVIDGDFDPGSVFTLRLSGHGTVNVWLQSTGGAAPEVSTGALIPRGEKQGTINIPASHPDLIAVGATVNRNRWRDSRGQPFLVGETEGGDQLLEVDGMALFSAAGPNALGVLKPDIVAPGMYVVGAMSSQADPRSNGGRGVFASQGRCGTPDYECFVTDDDAHAVTSGTSMSAPIVAGAIALLLQSRPELTQGQVRALLQAGARLPTGSVPAEQQLGPGVLDLNGSLAALLAEDSPIRRAPGGRSRIALSAPYIRPDTAQPLQGLLELRDEADQIADGFDERALRLTVTGGKVSKPPTRLAAGLYGFELTAPGGSGGRDLQLELSFDGRLLASRVVPIGVDRWAAEGEPIPRGGCGLAGASPRSAGLGWALLALFALRRWRYIFAK